MKYENPVIKGFNPDPSICFDGKAYYLVTSTFEFFPGVPVYKSDNLVNWELIGHCLTDAEQCNMTKASCSGGIYAPTIRYHNGVYYMVTTNVSNGGHLIVHTKDPSGKWSKPVFVAQGGIDPSLLFDGDKVYFTSTSGGKIVLCEIDPLTGEKYTEGVTISRGAGGKYPEAPHLYKIGEYYYLMLAEGGTEYGHMVTVFRSKDPYGPYEACPHNPVLTNRNEYRIHCAGHADMIEDANGNWWMVCLAVRTAQGALHNLGRETCLVPVFWEDGWPHAGAHGTVQPEMEGELPAAAEKNSFDFSDDFTGTAKKLPWTFIRNPFKKNYQLQNGKMRLCGDGIGLDDPQISPTFMGIRQTEFQTETTVEIETDCSDLDAGIAAYYNAFYYYALKLVREDDSLFAVLEKHIHDEKIISSRVKIPLAAKIKLSIVSDRNHYHFYAESDGQKNLIGKGHVAGLCTEATMMCTFTGVFLGIFAIDGTANFQNFRYKEIKE